MGELEWLDIPALLAWLGRCGGQEQRVEVGLWRAPRKRGDAGEWCRLGEYRLTARGEQIEATGPSGQTRLLSHERFAEVFTGHSFSRPRPTGHLTDLGPLFGDA